MTSAREGFFRAGAMALAALLLVGWGEAKGQTGSDLGVVRAVETYRLGQFDEARGALEQSLQGRLSEPDRAVALAYLGLIEMAVGRDPARLFWEAVLADPTLELDPAAHAPARIQRFDEIRRRLLEVATIEIVLGADTIEVGGETTVGLRVLNTEGTELRGLPVRYMTQGPAELVLVGGADRVRGRQAGEVMVVAEFSVAGTPRRVSKPLWVVDSVVRLQVFGPATISAGESRPFRVVVVGTDQAPRAPVQWRSSDVSVARVDAVGQVVGVSTGTVEILASSGGSQAVARVRVLPTGRTVEETPPPEIRGGSRVRVFFVVLAIVSSLVVAVRLNPF